MTTTLDALIREDNGLDGPAMLDLQRRLAAERYWLTEKVAQAKRDWSQKEADRKAVVIRARLMAKAEHTGKLSEVAATDIAESTGAVIRARHDEIEAEANYEALKLKLNASGDVLTSLTMRISDLKKERHEQRTFQGT